MLFLFCSVWRLLAWLCFRFCYDRRSIGSVSPNHGTVLLLSILLLCDEALPFLPFTSVAVSFVIDDVSLFAWFGVLLVWLCFCFCYVCKLLGSVSRGI